ncbi:glycoside hydrolase family 25 protein [Kutzneria buriramensis]|nr:glycoside hydrolase family 25 protein [Kutzneria buriramensis]
MYDSVNAAAIPANAGLVAGYVDGRYAWPAADWARFPHAVHVPIAVFATTNAGVVLDCETGDATPAQCPGWVRMRRAAGVDPTVYCSYSAWSTVRAAFAAAGEPAPHYWIAGYPDPVDADGNPVIPAGAVAHQWIDRGPYDESIVAEYWPGVDPNTPAPIEEENIMGNWMRYVDAKGNEASGLLLESGDFIGLPLPKTVRDAESYSNLTDGTDDAGAQGRWQDLVTRFDRDAKKLAATVTVEVNGQPAQATLNPSTGHYELQLVPDAPATTN